MRPAALPLRSGHDGGGHYGALIAGLECCVWRGGFSAGFFFTFAPFDAFEVSLSSTMLLVAVVFGQGLCASRS